METGSRAAGQRVMTGDLFETRSTAEKQPSQNL
jgi:hypothetical protein